MKKYYIGIDNGLQGGIAVIDEKHEIIETLPMPTISYTKKEYDVKKIYDVLYRYRCENAFLILEKAQPQFRDGKKQAFKTGYGYGIMQGLITALSISFQIVSPKMWQKKVFEGLNQDNTKMASIMFCQRKWPKHNWKASERCKKMHDGMTDACCMAYYGTCL